MKKLILSGFIFILGLFFLPNPVEAVLDRGMCDALSLTGKFTLLNETTSRAMQIINTDTQITNPTMYLDEVQKESIYIKENDVYKEVDLSKAFALDLKANDLMKNYSSSFANLPAGKLFPDNFVIHANINGACSDAEIKVNDLLTSANLTKNNFVNPSTTACKRVVAHRNYFGEFKIVLKYENESLDCMGLSYYNDVKKPIDCKLEIIDPLNEFSTQSTISIKATGVDVPCQNKTNWLDYTLQSSCDTPAINRTPSECENGWSDLKVVDGIPLSQDPQQKYFPTSEVGNKCANDLFFTYAQKFNAGNYKFRVVAHKWGTQQVQQVCSDTSLTIVPPGQIPTPPVQNINNNQLSNVYFSTSNPVQLCQTIPEDICCAGGDTNSCSFPNNNSCKSKCLACENKGMIWTALGCFSTDVNGLIKNVFTVFSGIIGAFIMLCVIASGLKIMTAQGNAETVKKANEEITSCIVGLLVLIFSVLFLKIVGVDILKIPGWGGV